MQRRTKINYRYSEAFKQQVLSDIESGKYSIAEARRVYGIKGDSTIQYWAKRSGILGILPKTVRVEKPDEKARIKELEAQIKQLKEALADTVLDRKIADATLEVICEQRGWDIEKVKKKVGTQLQGRSHAKKKKK